MHGILYVWGIVILFATCNNISVEGATMEDTKRLHSYLKANNDHRIRPKINQSETLDVYFSVYLVGIQHFDEIRQILLSDLALHFMWYHENTAWNVSDYGGLDIAFLPPTRAWLPDIGLFNVVDDWNERLKKESMNVIIHPNGTVAWAIHFTALGTVCAVDIAKYPFDEQRCQIRFGPFYLPEQKQNMMPFPMFGETISTLLYVENNEWELADYYLDYIYVGGFNDIKQHIIHLTLKRRSLFYILTVITPVLTLSMMNLVAFKLPASSGEKAGYCMAMFLTFVVLLNTISGSMPRISRTTSYLQVYIIIQLITSMIITTMSVGMVNMINKHDQENMPSLFVYMIKWSRRRSENRKIFTDLRKAVVSVVFDHTASGRKYQEAYRDKREDVKEEEPISKQEAANFVDKCLFYIFILMFIISTVLCFLKLLY